jgi:hypothetical protein
VHFGVDAISQRLGSADVLHQVAQFTCFDARCAGASSDTEPMTELCAHTRTGEARHAAEHAGFT